MKRKNFYKKLLSLFILTINLGYVQVVAIDVQTALTATYAEFDDALIAIGLIVGNDPTPGHAVIEEKDNAIIKAYYTNVPEFYKQLIALKEALKATISTHLPNTVPADVKMDTVLPGGGPYNIKVSEAIGRYIKFKKKLLTPDQAAAVNAANAAENEANDAAAQETKAQTAWNGYVFDPDNPDVADATTRQKIVTDARAAVVGHKTTAETHEAKATATKTGTPGSTDYHHEDSQKKYVAAIAKLDNILQNFDKDLGSGGYVAVAGDHVQKAKDAKAAKDIFNDFKDDILDKITPDNVKKSKAGFISFIDTNLLTQTAVASVAKKGLYAKLYDQLLTLDHTDIGKTEDEFEALKKYARKIAGKAAGPIPPKPW